MTSPEGSPQRVALVTGGAVRVGAAISLGLAESGYDVTISYRSSEAEARTLEGRILELGRRCLLVRADLLDPDAPETIVDRTREAFGRLDLLVNSASSFDAAHLLDVDRKRWDAVLGVNLTAPHLLVRAAADLLRTARGSVINLLDLSAVQPWTSYPHHAVAKAGLAHLTRIQARALAPEIRVNAVAPGAVLRPEDMGSGEWDALAGLTPLGANGTPQDVLEAVFYLAGAPFVTGQILVVDGGRSLGPPPGRSHF